MQFLLTAVSLFTALVAASPVELDKRVTHVGTGTIFYQEGGIGSCGQKSSDSDYIVAISNYWMKDQSPGPYCGRKIKITNTGPDGDGSVKGKGNTITVTVKDTCPSCDENHLDLSKGAWKALTDNSADSHVGISWNFLAQ